VREGFILLLNGPNYTIKINYMKKLPIISIFVKWYENYKMKKKLKKKLEELKKRDPFVYKSF
jgi:tRNA(Ser,Leu) C12 N-acetylase TAN1